MVQPMFGNFSLKLEEPHNFTPTIIDKHYAKKVHILTELKGVKVAMWMAGRVGVMVIATLC